MKALVGAFNQEKALVGALFVIVKTGSGTDGALHSTNAGAAEHQLGPAAGPRQPEEGAGADQPEAGQLHAQHQDLLEPGAQEGARSPQGRVRQVRSDERSIETAQL